MRLPARAAIAVLVVALGACHGKAKARAGGGDGGPAARGGVVTLSIVGTSDWHGRALGQGQKGGAALFAGYLANLRAARARDGGVVLIDAGDMFQGTLESNLGEGALMVEVMNALGYQAAAIGNHEFDFGPVGEATTVSKPGDDPRGALAARAAEAKFPFLAANVIDDASNRPVAWKNVLPSTLIEVAGVKVGLLGVTTEATPHTTMAANFVGLHVAPLAETIATEAAALRVKGALVVIVAAHAGGKCSAFSAVDDKGCEPGEEIMAVAKALPPGAVDVIVAGHTHQAMANLVAGIPVVEAWSNGRGFSRVDLQVDVDAHTVRVSALPPPQEIVEGSYEGKPVVADASIAALYADDVERARARREESLGVTLTEGLRRSYDHESAEGNLFTDMLLLWGAGHGDVALQNGGGLRADLPAGLLTYGALYEGYPFDNRVARVKMTAGALRKVIARNLGSSGGILSIAGVRARATCKGGVIEVTLERQGRPLADDTPLVVLTSDFLATGGDGAFAAAGITAADVTILDAPMVRDAIAEALRRRGGTIRPADLVDGAVPRLGFPGERPLRCR